MNDNNTTAEIGRLCWVEAMAWRMHLHEIDADTTPEFEEWRSNPENEAAWCRVAVAWREVGAYPTAPELIEMRQAALGDARRASADRRRAGGGRWAVVFAGIALTVALSGGMTLRRLTGPDDWTTKAGERRVVMLADGSRVSLDSDSEVLVKYREHARELELRRGQARFDVAHDAERPFSVLARDQKIVATGTAFTVDLVGLKVLVTLIEGHVVVLDAQMPTALVPRTAITPRPLELRAGEQMTAQPARAPEIAQVNLERATAWQNGRLIFVDEPLSSVVARVNRYTTAPITIDDMKAATLRISGVFNTGDIRGFLDIVTHYLPIVATKANDGRIVLRMKS